ncbi:MAG: molybdenum cofactor guanylyltransferase [Chloroflexota bacterium]|nr:molybdenum cofactor guanylyltransferase [Chloroflexota bacterium]
MKVSAAVMAGGKSRRMGRDKAWLDLGDGTPIVRRATNVLAGVADEVFVVANDTAYDALGLRVVRDRYADGGALGGIATAVAAAAGEVVLVAACDMPFLSAPVWRLLIQLAPGNDVVVPRVGGQFETLHAVYAKSGLWAMESALASRRMRVISFFPDVRVRDVGEDELRTADPELRSFTNVNTPEELETAKRLAAIS